MEELKLFKVRLKLAREYFSGKDSGYKCSKDLAESFARKAEKTAGLNLDPGMSLKERIEWMEAFN